MDFFLFEGAADFGCKLVERPCHGNASRAESERRQSDLCSGDSRLPSCRRFGSEDPQCRSGNEVTLKIERVVDGGMDAEEALGGSS